MKLTTDDPKLTAYALGELDAAERAAVEAALAESPECRAAVEEIRATAGRLTSELAAEPCPELTPAQRAAIAAPAAAKVVPFPWWRAWRTAGIAAVAACVVGLVGWAMFGPQPEKSLPKAGEDLARLNTTIAAYSQTYGSKQTIHSAASPGTPQHPTNESLLPASKLQLRSATLHDVIDLYQEVSGKTVFRAGALPPDRFTIDSQTPLVREDALQVLDTILAQRGITMVPQGMKFVKAVPEQVTFAEGKNFDPDASGVKTFQGAQHLTVTVGKDTPSTIVLKTTQSPVTESTLLAGTGFTAALQVGDPMSQGATFSADGKVQYVNGGTVTYAAQANPANPTQPGYVSQGQVIPQRPASGASFGSGSPGFRFSKQLQQRVWREGDDGLEIVSQRLDGVPAQPGYTPITAYAPFIENAFVSVLQEPLSTFSTDVDTASYANVRRFLNSGQLPPRDAVRIEELVNYFSYAYPAPRGEDPFSASIETAGCPWAPEHRLVRVALKGRELPRGKRPPSNFVFLIDVSGSMQPAERLPLLKQALRALVKKMTDTDRVAIVVYASEAGVKLESLSCAEKEKILAVIDALEAGGSTNGGEGIQQAYAMARKHFIKGGVNRVLLCTDGDFNVGLTDQNALVALVKENAASGVFLTTLGVGTDNYKDALMQRLADKANGNYHYLDTLEEAQKVLIEQMNATLVTIAKDVKVQVEFNPAQVSAYRLIGYEKRMLRAQDFNNDRKDAGEIGAGHTVTAFYEVVPAGAAAVRPVVDKLKYQSAVAPASYSANGESSKELLTLKLRYKQPDGDTSKLIEFPHTDSGGSYGKASGDFKFAASVASFGMLLRESEHKGSASFASVLELAEEGKGSDEGGWRAEFINLVKKAKGLRGGGRATFE